MKIGIPFYKVGRIFIDAYFMDKLESKADRIILVRANLPICENFERKLEPLQFYSIVNLLNEGYEEVKNFSFSNRTSLETSDLIFSVIYNSGYYFKKREKELISQSLSKFYTLVYENVFGEIMRSSSYNLLYTSVNIDKGKITICDVDDKVYEKLYETDSGFKNAVVKIANFS